MKIVDSINFIAFYDKVKSQTMAAPTAYRFSKLYAKVKEDETFYQTRLREILFDCGELDENGNLIPIDDGKGIKLKPEKQEECLTRINELQEIDSDIDFEPLPLDILNGLEVSPSDLEGVTQFFA